MAEVTAFRNNALPYPVYGAPWVVVFPLLDADGDPVTGATCDSEISKNGDTAVDCTNEGVEIAFDTATNKGMYYLIVTTAEMTADIAAITVYSATSKATVITLYPRKLVPLRSGTAQGGAAGYITLDASAGAADDLWNGCLCVATIDGNVEVRLIDDYTGASQQAAVTPDWNVEPDADDTFIIYLPEGRALPSVDLAAVSGDRGAADNLESACDAYSATRGLAGTALPAAAADAAGGLPVSDAGGLDLDAQKDVIDIIQGLVQCNIRWSSITYDANNQLTSVILSIYPTAADVDNETNAIAAFTHTAAYNASGEITAYKVKKN